MRQTLPDAIEDDINKSIQCGPKGQVNHRIHVFVATSSIHREYKLKLAKEEIIKNAVSSISLAKSLCDDIGIPAPEDRLENRTIHT